MRLSLRFILPLMLVLGLIAYSIVPLVDSLVFSKWFTRDIDIRTKLIANTLQDSIISIVENPSEKKIQRLFGRAIQDERLYALAFCDNENGLVYKTQTFPDQIVCEKADISGGSWSRVLDLPSGPLHVAYYPIEDSGSRFGQLVLVHDMSFLEKRSADTKTYIFYLFAGLAAVISLITVLIAQMSWRGWVKVMRAILKGEGLIRPN